MRASIGNTVTPPSLTPDSPIIPMEDHNDVALLERAPQKVSPPPLYQVVMLNDDFTPMEFVVYAIQEFFHKSHETAVQIMLKIHSDGRGVCGVFPRDIAITKAERVVQEARSSGHPLHCISEPVDT